MAIFWKRWLILSVIRNIIAFLALTWRVGVPVATGLIACAKTFSGYGDEKYYTSTDILPFLFFILEIEIKVYNFILLNRSLVVQIDCESRLRLDVHY